VTAAVVPETDHVTGRPARSVTCEVVTVAVTSTAPAVGPAAANAIGLFVTVSATTPSVWLGVVIFTVETVRPATYVTVAV